MKTLFGKKKSANSFPNLSYPITASFAQEVLDLEEQLNINCSLPIVNRLLTLYTIAIEYYEAEKNLKHIHYQERMQLLLSKNNVLQLFNAHNSPVSSPRSAPSSSPRHKTIATELVLERNCEKVLKDHLTGNSDASNKIKDNIKNQTDGLSQRLISRKLSSPRNSKRFNFEESSTDRENPVEEFEKEVEEILEKYVNEKTKLKKGIKEKYEEYFHETSLVQGDLKALLMEELKKNMHKEIEEAVQDADGRRNDEVASARQRLNRRI